MSPLNINGKCFSFFILLLLMSFAFFCSASSPSEAAEVNFDLDKNGVYTSVEYIDSLISSFNEKLNANFDSIKGYAKNLFASLFLIQLVWSILQLILQENCTLGSLIVTFARQIFIGLFFWWLLLDHTILRTIVASFSQMATQGLNLGELLNKQWDLVKAIWGMTSITDGSLLLGVATCLVLCYVVSTAVGMLAVTYLENVVAGSLGFILMGFGGAEWTRSFALSYIRSLVAIGFKLFLVCIILSVGIQTFDTLVGTVKVVESKVIRYYGYDGVVATEENVSKAIIENARTTSEAGSVSEICFSLIASAFLFHALVQLIPSITSTMLAGATLGAGVGHALATGAGSLVNTVAGSAIMLGSIGAGGIQGGMNAYKQKNATQAAAESYDPGIAKKVAKTASTVGSVLAGTALGATKTAMHEVSKDLGSPSFRGSRTQRFFESVANNLEAQKNVRAGEMGEMNAPPKNVTNPETEKISGQKNEPI
jgi:type IV secretion system protein TrbL